jgi:glycerol kinase
MFPRDTLLPAAIRPGRRGKPRRLREELIWSRFLGLQKLCHSCVASDLPGPKVDGGATENDFLMQLQADVLGIPVVRPAVRETTALGAAQAAGLARGVYGSLTELSRLWRADRTFQPEWSAARREEAHRGWTRAVSRSRGWLEP